MISFNEMYYVIRLIFFMIVVFFIYQLIHSNIKAEVDIFDVESSLVMQRFLFDSNSFSYIDEDTDRQYIGIIDKEKFTKEYYDEVLSKGVYFNSEDPHLSGKLTLKDISGNVINSLIYNKKQYDIWAPIAKAGYTQGRGGIQISTKNFYVLIKDNDELKKGILEIEVIMPKD